MALLNLTQAAKLAGITRTTLYKHIKQGKVSSSLDMQDNTVIDSSDIVRVYSGTVSDNVYTEHDYTPDTVHPLQVEIEVLKAQNKLLRDQLFKTEQRELRLLDQVDKLTDTIKQIEPEPAPVKKPQTFWQRVFNSEE